MEALSPPERLASRPEDAETLAWLLRQGERVNTSLARQKDLRHFLAWLAAVRDSQPGPETPEPEPGIPKPGKAKPGKAKPGKGKRGDTPAASPGVRTPDLTGQPVTEKEICLFIAHHLYDPDERRRNRSHGMPAAIARQLLAAGVMQADKQDRPYCASTVRRMLSSLRWYLRRCGMADPADSPLVREVLRAACGNAPPPRRKSGLAITADVLRQMLATCDSDSLMDRRDHALLCFLYASGGRRRSEAQGIQAGDIRIIGHDGSDVVIDIVLGRTKRTERADGHTVTVVGTAARSILDWMQRAGIVQGPVFRSLARGQAAECRLTARGLCGRQVAWIVRRRLELAGCPPGLYSAHGIRSGYLTDGVQQGISQSELMHQAALKTPAMLSRYYNDHGRRRSQAARMGRDL